MVVACCSSVAVVCVCVALPFPLHQRVCASLCNVGVLGRVDGLSGSPGPGGTALVNNSDEAHYQGSADFSLIPP